MRSILILASLFLSWFAQADEQISARVVSIYRPLEMQSRRVQVKRKVFIQSDSEADFPDKLVGQKLIVYRLRPVPAQVDMLPTSTQADAVTEEQAPSPTTRAQQKRPTSDSRLAPLESGRPAGFAAPSEQSLSTAPIYLGAETSAGDVVTKVEDAAVETAFVKTKVGEIKVLSVEGNVAIAAVVKDGIRKKNQSKPSVRNVEGSTVSAGDFAEGVVKKIIPKKKAKPLSKSERKALLKERARIRKMNRPKKKRRKYRRKNMQWDY